MRGKSFSFWVILLAILSGFIFRIYTYYCPDFGWHLRLGWLMSDGIPNTDPFSFTMPSYPFIEHEYFSDMLITGIFTFFGYVGLSVIFSLIALAALVLQIRKNQIQWSILPFFLAAATVFPFLGVRPQVISWLFFSVLFFLLIHKALWQRFKYVVPFLFLLWANVHGGFPLGLGIFALAIVVQFIENKKITKTALVLFFISVGVTFINPFGYHLWESIWQQSADPIARNFIEEWFPSIYLNSTAFWVYAVLSLALIINYRRKFTSFELVAFGLLLMAGLWSMRHVPFWAIVSLSMTSRVFGYLADDAARIVHGADRMRKVYTVCFVTLLLVILPNVWYTYHRFLYFSEQGIFSSGAASYLQSDTKITKVFAPYEMGGYILWKAPFKQVFIYGMMPSWKRDTAPAGESPYAFQEYIDLLVGKEPFQKAVSKYHMNGLVIPLVQLEDSGTLFPWVASYANIFGKALPEQKNYYLPLAKSAEQLGWEKVYQDRTVAIYKPK